MTTKILFVDDEANVLAGLRRMLRGQRQVWDMHFANGGEEALRLMEQQAFDVVVTDMRMPNIDGAELLTRVSNLYPHTVRLVLSGQSEHEKIFRAVGPAHQFMSKPCDPDVLVSTIERACGLHSQLRSDSLKKLTSQLRCLPSLPEVYRELIVELESDEASIRRVSDKIASDIAMTAKVLQLVNSSFFGQRQQIKCPHHAVTLLGLNIIRPLVLTANVFSQQKDPHIDCFSLQQLVDHSLAVSVTARSIAEHFSDEPFLVNDTFAAGLLHDIGKLVLATNLPEEYALALQLTRDESMSIWEAEKRIFDATHADVGAHLLGLWGLPHPVVEAIAYHHRPADALVPHFSPITAVHIANALELRDCGDSGNVPELCVDYLNGLGLPTELDAYQPYSRAANREMSEGAVV
ncbi:MAG: response regulator [Pirellulaceae bacterium]